MPAPSASGFDLLCRNTTIATADRQQTNATTITAVVVARMPKFIVGPQPVGTSRVFPQPARSLQKNQPHQKSGGVRQQSEPAKRATANSPALQRCVREKLPSAVGICVVDAGLLARVERSCQTAAKRRKNAAQGASPGVIRGSGASH